MIALEAGASMSINPSQSNPSARAMIVVLVGATT